MLFNWQFIRRGWWLRKYARCSEQRIYILDQNVTLVRDCFVIRLFIIHRLIIKHKHHLLFLSEFITRFDAAVLLSLVDELFDFVILPLITLKRVFKIYLCFIFPNLRSLLLRFRNWALTLRLIKVLIKFLRLKLRAGYHLLNCWALTFSESMHLLILFVEINITSVGIH